MYFVETESQETLQPIKYKDQTERVRERVCNSRDPLMKVHYFHYVQCIDSSTPTVILLLLFVCVACTEPVRSINL